MLLVGSHGLSFYTSEIGRKPRDVDLIGTTEELRELVRALRATSKRCRVEPLSKSKSVVFADGSIFEFEHAWAGSTGRSLLDSGNQRLVDPLSIGIDDSKVEKTVVVWSASLDQLYTLKMSHRFLKNSPHFLKTMRDIQLMRSLGAKIWDAAWLKRREDETYTYKHPKLNVMKGNFFAGDGVKYVYDHDDIHRSMAIFVDRNGDPQPAYELYKAEGHEVLCSKRRFLDSVEPVKLRGVLEEALVLALERSQIPFRDRVDPRRSFEIALMKVCTSITSGWFREYAWENYDRVVQMFETTEHDYVDRFWAAVDGGKVRSYNGKNEN